ncbi:cyclic lactone autoinducer peptide [Paenibacillus spiritus]|uniref:Cyclic lactone autoinducer peptide n=1 Tax=Paenibacillus spiritus TaxID=2496557 RepID=A0A5J5GIZ5_9BACL|nr:cyclic lactone autoinducer peptide [Paenibacillus spiritus]KAA9007464.1 cyclic lactone autoinducer peptide [Paenibacillus spiritus]
MKKAVAKYASKALLSTAKAFASALKPLYHSPEIPQELRK